MQKKNIYITFLHNSIYCQHQTENGPDILDIFVSNMPSNIKKLMKNIFELSFDHSLVILI